MYFSGVDAEFSVGLKTLEMHLAQRPLTKYLFEGEQVSCRLVIFYAMNQTFKLWTIFWVTSQRLGSQRTPPPPPPPPKKKNFWCIVFLGHWSTCFGYLVTSVGFKSRVGSLVSTWWGVRYITFHRIHLLCYTCWPHCKDERLRTLRILMYLFFKMGNLLVCGPRGVGKSALCQALCHALGCWPNLAHVTLLQCKPLRGK